MGTVYRVVFSDGKTPAALDKSLAGAVTWDGNDSGELVAGEYQALLVGGEIVPLPHPLEDRTIREHGETFLSASIKGALLHVVQRLCLQCGTLFDAPKISFSSAAGFLPGLLVAAAAGLYVRVAAGWQTRDAVAVAFGTLFGLMLLMTNLGWAYSKVRWGARQRAIEKASCPRCSSRSTKAISAMAGKTTKLLDKNRSVAVAVAGRS